MDADLEEIRQRRMAQLGGDAGQVFSACCWCSSASCNRPPPCVCT